MYVHEQTADWVPHTFAAAAIIQPVIAQIQAGFISGLVEGEPFISKHPSSGKRAEMDDMLNVIEHVYAPEGQKENSWKNSGEFEEVAKFFNGVDGFSMADPSGLTSEFAWGPNRTSMMNAVLNQPHPQLGNGVLIRLNLPLSFDRTKATRIAGHLNQMEAISMNRAHQLGAWCVGASETVVYVSFLPNIMYKPGVLTQLLLANGIRARWAAATLSPEAEAGEAIDIVKRRLEDLM